jgi:hypothetical protein
MVFTAKRWMFAALCGLILCAVAPAPAFAQSATDRARAAELKKRGDDAMDLLKPEEAIKAYEEAYAITGDPAILYGKGRAYGVMGRFPEALADLEAFERKAPPDLRAKVPQLASLIVEMRSKTATLSLRGSVAGARVMLNDRVVGHVGADGTLRVVVNSGRGKLEVTKENFVAFKRDLDLPSAGTASFEAALSPQRSAGVLVVHVNPRDSVVFVDGRAVGAPPVEVPVSAGPHAVRVTADGYSDMETRAVVDTASRKELALDLRKKSVFEAWWFWTTIAAVAVAGGVVIGYAVTTEREASTGDIQPGRVRGPLVTF